MAKANGQGWPSLYLKQIDVAEALYWLCRHYGYKPAVAGPDIVRTMFTPYEYLQGS